jgi:putative transposase
MGRSVGCQIFGVYRWWADILGRSVGCGYYGSIGGLRKLRARDARPYGGFGYSVDILLILYPMGRYNPQYHHRRSIRLRNYDYSQCGRYFVTICIQNRECLLGSISQGHFLASESGKVVQQSLKALQQNHPETTIESWVVMPNHIHFILEIHQQTDVALGELVRQFKYTTTKQINALRNSPGTKIWQRNYYENIIRTDRGHQIIRDYIQQNPIRWEIDQLHPQIPSKW